MSADSQRRLIDGFWLRLPALELVSACRVLVSRGTTLAGETSDAGPHYVAKARIPAPGWRALSETEFRELQAVPEMTGPGDVIRIIPVPDAAIEPFRRMAPEGTTATWNGAGALRESGFEVAERNAVDYARTLALNSEGLVGLGREIRRPGQTTTTVDERLGRRVGLHVDSWDGWDCADFRSRQHCRTRLSINLGTEPRYLLFMRVPGAELWSHADEASRLLGPTHLLQVCLQARPDLPVYRLEVRPAEAYIAPIDGMPHDSSTLGMIGDDISLSVIGHFDTLGE